MKNILKVFSFILLVSLFVGCDNEELNQNINKKHTILNIDSCQYIYYSRGYGSVLAHKGNCLNPIHCYND